MGASVLDYLVRSEPAGKGKPNPVSGEKGEDTVSLNSVRRRGRGGPEGRSEDRKGGAGEEGRRG